MTMRELWEKTCELLAENMNEVSYNTWIKQLEPEMLEENVLTLRVAAGYLKSAISNKYSSLINASLTSVAGRPMQMRLVTESDLVQEPAPVHTPTPVTMGNMPLNPKYTFDTFVVGGSNQFAHAASLAVAESPAEAYNPLFIYGGAGLGKTHLMHAIGHYVLAERPQMRIMCVTSENFTNELITAISQKNTAEFRNRFRDVDILMVDDIQFIGGRESTQEEFFHTFNALHSSGKQIIMTSDRPPKEIARLEERLRSRFEWGMIADIQKPDVETRIAILRRLAVTEGIDVGDDSLEVIARRVVNNIRELEGCMKRVVMYANLMKQPITVNLCEEVLRDVFPAPGPKAITPDVVIGTVADYYDMAAEDITGNSRKREIAVPRQIAMYLLRDMTELSLPQIGQAFGGRDHSTVLYGINQIAKGVEKDSKMKRLIEDIRHMIKDE